MPAFTLGILIAFGFIICIACRSSIAPGNILNAIHDICIRIISGSSIAVPVNYGILLFLVSSIVLVAVRHRSPQRDEGDILSYSFRCITFARILPTCKGIVGSFRIGKHRNIHTLCYTIALHSYFTVLIINRIEGSGILHRQLGSDILHRLIVSSCIIQMCRERILHSLRIISSFGPLIAAVKRDHDRVNKLRLIYSLRRSRLRMIRSYADRSRILHIRSDVCRLSLFLNAHIVHPDRQDRAGVLHQQFNAILHCGNNAGFILLYDEGFAAKIDLASCFVNLKADLILAILHIHSIGIGIFGLKGITKGSLKNLVLQTIHLMLVTRINIDLARFCNNNRYGSKFCIYLVAVIIFYLNDIAAGNRLTINNQALQIILHFGSLSCNGLRSYGNLIAVSNLGTRIIHYGVSAIIIVGNNNLAASLIAQYNKTRFIVVVFHSDGSGFKIIILVVVVDIISPDCLEGHITSTLNNLSTGLDTAVRVSILPASKYYLVVGCAKYRINFRQVIELYNLVCIFILRIIFIRHIDVLSIILNCAIHKQDRIDSVTGNPCIHRCTLDGGIQVGISRRPHKANFLVLHPQRRITLVQASCILPYHRSIFCFSFNFQNEIRLNLYKRSIGIVAEILRRHLALIACIDGFIIRTINLNCGFFRSHHQLAELSCNHHLIGNRNIASPNGVCKFARRQVLCRTINSNTLYVIALGNFRLILFNVAVCRLHCNGVACILQLAVEHISIFSYSTCRKSLVILIVDGHSTCAITSDVDGYFFIFVCNKVFIDINAPNGIQNKITGYRRIEVVSLFFVNSILVGAPELEGIPMFFSAYALEMLDFFISCRISCLFTSKHFLVLNRRIESYSFTVFIKRDAILSLCRYLNEILICFTIRRISFVQQFARNRHNILSIAGNDAIGKIRGFCNITAADAQASQYILFAVGIRYAYINCITIKPTNLIVVELYIFTILISAVYFDISYACGILVPTPCNRIYRVDNLNIDCSFACKGNRIRSYRNLNCNRSRCCLFMILIRRNRNLVLIYRNVLYINCRRHGLSDLSLEFACANLCLVTVNHHNIFRHNRFQAGFIQRDLGINTYAFISNTNIFRILTFAEIITQLNGHLVNIQFLIFVGHTQSFHDSGIQVFLFLYSNALIIFHRSGGITDYQFRQRFHIAIRICISAPRAGVRGIALRIVSRRGDFSFVVMALGIYLGIGIGIVAAAAGMRGVTICRAGRRSNDCFVIMRLRIYFNLFSAAFRAAYAAGISPHALSLTGGLLGDFALITLCALMAQCRDRYCLSAYFFSTVRAGNHLILAAIIFTAGPSDSFVHRLTLGMALRFNLFLLGNPGLAYRALHASRQTIFGAGCILACHSHFRMTLGVCRAIHIGIAADRAGMGGVTPCRTGRGGDYGSILVPVRTCLHHTGILVSAADAGIGHFTVFFAGGML